MYEVELKFPLPDPAALRARLAARGLVAGAPLEQRDTYFRHPARDFAETDEALRVRTVGQKHVVTYKGPLIDRQTKTRREIEVPLAEPSENGQKFREILELLGFEIAREVSKVRTPFHLQHQGRDFEIALDEVSELGTFLELETLADDATRDAARDALLDLAAELELAHPERRSYLALLLAQDRKKS